MFRGVLGMVNLLEDDGFRDIFVQTLERLVGQLPECGVSPPHINIQYLLRNSEQETAAASNKLIETFSKKLASAVGFSYEVVYGLTLAAWNTANGHPEKVEQKALLFGLEYMQMINSLQASVGKQNGQIQICVADNGDGGIITAYASNGHSIMRHECHRCYVQGAPFSGQINIPSTKPGKLELVTLSLSGPDTIMCFGAHKEVYSPSAFQQNLPAMWADLIKKLSAQRKELLLSPVFLRDMAAGMRAGTLTPAPMRISMGAGQAPVSVQCGPTQALFMPLVERV